MGFSLSRGLFHPGLPVPTSRRAHRDTGRWQQVGLRRGPRSKARQMRYLLLRYALLLFFSSFISSSHRCGPLFSPPVYSSTYAHSYHGCVTGINSESSFERDLLQRAPGCEAWGYDYSVNDIRVPTSPSFFYRAPLTHGRP